MTDGGKKNKKVSLAQKPFWVLSRRAVGGWLAVILLVGGWMFAIGVMVGRDKLPAELKINPLQKALEPFRDKQDNEDPGPESRNSDSGAGETGLEFYEALPEDREDADIAARPRRQEPKVDVKPPATQKDGLPAPPAKAPAPKIKRSMKRLTKARLKSKQPARTSPKEVVDPTPSQASVYKGQANGSGKPYTIQAAAFKRAADADKLVAKLRQKGFSAYRAMGKVPGKGIWYRVRVGEFNGKTDASQLMLNLKKLGYKPALVEK